MPGPVRDPVHPLVLGPVAVRLLRRDEVGEGAPGRGRGAQGDERPGRFDEIARPDQVVAAQVVASVAPRDRQAGHGCARHGSVLVRPQDRRRGQVQVAILRRQIGRRIDDRPEEPVPVRRRTRPRRSRSDRPARRTLPARPPRAASRTRGRAGPRRRRAPARSCRPRCRRRCVAYVQVIRPFAAKSCQPSDVAHVADALAYRRRVRGQCQRPRPVLGEEHRAALVACRSRRGRGGR